MSMIDLKRTHADNENETIDSDELFTCKSEKHIKPLYCRKITMKYKRLL